MSDKKFSINEIIDDWYYSNSTYNGKYRVLYRNGDEREFLIRKLIARIKEVGYDREDILRSHISQIIYKCIGNVKDRKKKEYLTNIIEETIRLAIHDIFGSRAYQDPKIEFDPLHKKTNKSDITEKESLNLIEDSDREVPCLSLSDYVDHEFCDFLGVPRSHRE